MHRFTCDCGTVLKVNDHLAGKRVKCPSCGNSVLAEARKDESISPARKKRDEAAAAEPAPRKTQPETNPSLAKQDNGKKRGGGLLLVLLGGGLFAFLLLICTGV